MLENESGTTTFGASSPATYLNTVVKPAGAYIQNYYATGHVSLDNYISMISGQGGTAMTDADCQDFLDSPPTPALGPSGQSPGALCVYPAIAPTIVDELGTAGISWKSYAEDMGNDPVRDNGTSCAHPALNARDTTQSAAANDQFAGRHDPFLYFHSIIDSPVCKTNVVSATSFASDLSTYMTTPQYAFYTPNLCDDGHDAPCVATQNGSLTGGLTNIDLFLRKFVPLVTNSAAYKKDGVLIIIFDEASPADVSSCCAEVGNGGGITGAVILSPFIKPGTLSPNSYNHYSMLLTVSKIFGVTPPGYAAAGGLAPFGTDVFSASNYVPSARFRH